MSCQFYESFPSRKSSDKDAERLYMLIGSADEVFVRQYARMATPTVTLGLLRKDIEVNETAPGTWEVRPKYGTRDQKQPEAGDMKWEFDTTATSQKITQSKQTVNSYGIGGSTPANFGGAIGVHDDSVDGCEVLMPQFRWHETHQLDAADVDFSYAQTLYQLTGKTNQASFRNFGEKQVLFLGAKGSWSARAANIVEITYSFSAATDATGLTIGDITGVAKKAWDYLWVLYGMVGSGGGSQVTQLAKKPKAAYVERVYDSADYSRLGIGN